MPKNDRAARGRLVTLAATASILVAIATLLAAPAAAQSKKVPGEKWRNTISVQAMGMNMPQRTFEICVPKGKENESMAKPEKQENCKLYDARQSGNSYSAKMRCTGDPPMEGTFESTKDGNTVRGSSVIRTEGMEMRTQFSATPLGTACEAIEYTGPEPTAARRPEPTYAEPNECASLAGEIGSIDLAALAGSFAGAGASCRGNAAALKRFCDAVQTPAGFNSLATAERNMAAIGAGGDPGEYASVTKPLTTSLGSCGVAADAAGIDALRARLIPVAEKEGAWDFLVVQGDAAAYARLTETAKRECSGRNYTSARSSRYERLCGSYGMALVRGDREGAQQAAGVSSAGTAGGKASRPGGANPAAGTNVPEPAPEAAPADAPKDKLKEGLDRGRRVLRGLLGN